MTSKNKKIIAVTRDKNMTDDELSAKLEKASKDNSDQVHRVNKTLESYCGNSSAQEILKAFDGLDYHSQIGAFTLIRTSFKHRLASHLDAISFEADVIREAISKLIES